MGYFKLAFMGILCMSYSITSLAQNASQLIQKQLSSKEYALEEGAFVLIKEHVSSTSGVHHIYFQQAVDGIPIYGTESSFHTSAAGQMVHKENNFFGNIKAPTALASKELLSAEKCVQFALATIAMDATSLKVNMRSKNATRETVMEISTMPSRPIKAVLGYELNNDKELKEFWSFAILDHENSNYWSFRVDAITGLIISQEDIISRCDFAGNEKVETLNYHKNLYDRPNYKAPETENVVSCENCYEVIPFPYSNPYVTTRSVVISPGHPEASPYGWHDIDGNPGSEGTITEGNNVVAIEANDQYGFQPDGGVLLDFTGYEFDPIFEENNQSVNASITNLFYWTNLLHDIFYVYGFNEAAGNFQSNNYGKGGVAGDRLEAFGQAGGGECSAFFGALNDGEKPFMKINLCGSKDGDFDNTVIIHEYAHGLISRTRVGGIGGICNGGNGENPKEGWCDWFAAVLTIEPEDTGDKPRPIASYFFDQGPTGSGVRSYPYSTDPVINPQDYGSLNNEMGSHSVGAVWGEILWEMTWSLIDYYGYNPDLYSFTGDVNQDAGNIMALAVVIEGLKLTPCAVGFETARDGIILAANIIYGPEVSCLLWESFARRGMGYGARQGDTNDLEDQHVSYDDNFNALFDLGLVETCSTSAIYRGLNGGNPVGGSYSGPGVVDDENGRTFTFDPSVAGTGEHEVIYSIPESPCYEAAAVNAFINVVEDDIPPIIYCYDDIIVKNVDDERYTIPDFADLVVIEDNCSEVTTYSQSPAAGAVLKEGLVEMEISSSDESNNTSICTFKIEISHVVENPVLLGNSLEIFPNPFIQNIQLRNPLKTSIQDFQIRDIHGRLIKDEKLGTTSSDIPISLEGLSSGIYFMNVNFRKLSKSFKLVKQ